MYLYYMRFFSFRFVSNARVLKIYVLMPQSCLDLVLLELVLQQHKSFCNYMKAGTLLGSSGLLTQTAEVQHTSNSQKLCWFLVSWETGWISMAKGHTGSIPDFLPHLAPFLSCYSCEQNIVWVRGDVYVARRPTQRYVYLWLAFRFPP